MFEFLAAINKNLLTIRNLLAGTSSLTDSQLRASPLDVNLVSGNITIGSEIEITNDNGNPVSITGTVEAVINHPLIVNVGLTDTELRATPIPISGAGDATDATLSTLLKPADTLTAVTTVGTITNVVHVDDNGGSLTVDGTVTAIATDLDIRNLTHTADSIMIGDGTDYLAIDGSGRIGVTNAFLDASLSTLSTETTLQTVANNTIIIANTTATENTLQSVLDEVTLHTASLQALDNAVAGNELQVDIVSMPNVTATSTPDLTSISYDAGARQRVSQLTTLGDYKILNADRTLLLETAGTGTGAFSNNKYTMTVTNGQYLVRQTKKYHPYFSGKSQIVEFTFENFHVQANVIKRIGYFSSNAVAPYDSDYDGIYLENDGTNIRFRITHAGTTVLNVTQANWNVNTLNGHDWSLFNVVLIDFLWLGGAVVRLYVKTVSGFQLCHVYSHAGAFSDTMTHSSNQPIRYEIRGNGAGGTMTYICSQVSTEGSIDEAGIIYAVTHGSSGIVLNSVGTTYPLLGIRKRSSHRDVPLSIMDFRVLTASNNDQLKLWLLLNPTLSAPLTYNVTPYASEYGIGNGTITVSSVGLPILIGFSAQNTTIDVQKLNTNFLSWLGSTLNNTMDEIILAATPITATITTHSCITIKEF